MYIDKEKEMRNALSSLSKHIPEFVGQEIEKKILDAFEDRFIAGDDFYLNEENAFLRLTEEYEKHKLIVAFDFDNTVFDYNERGFEYKNVIELLRVCKEVGCYLSVFTSDGWERIPQIEEYLKKHNIPYDGINENPDVIKFNGRKIYYNVLLDDRAGLPSAYRVLSRVVYNARIKNHQKGMADIA